MDWQRRPTGRTAPQGVRFSQTESAPPTTRSQEPSLLEAERQRQADTILLQFVRGLQQNTPRRPDPPRGFGAIFNPQPGPTVEMARLLEHLSRPRGSAPAAAPAAAPAGSGGGGGGVAVGFDGSPFDAREQMLQDLFGARLQAVQDMRDQGAAGVGMARDDALSRLTSIRDEFTQQQQLMQQQQAQALAAALARVTGQQQALNADLAAQGGGTVDGAAAGAVGVLEAQGANQGALGSRLAQLQQQSFADRASAAEAMAQSGLQQLDAGRARSQQAILEERLQALTGNRVDRLEAETAQREAVARARRGGGGGRGGGAGSKSEMGAMLAGQLGLDPATGAAMAELGLLDDYIGDTGIFQGGRGPRQDAVQLAADALVAGLSPSDVGIDFSDEEIVAAHALAGEMFARADQMNRTNRQRIAQTPRDVRNVGAGIGHMVFGGR